MHKKSGPWRRKAMKTEGISGDRGLGDRSDHVRAEDEAGVVENRRRKSCVNFEGKLCGCIDTVRHKRVNMDGRIVYSRCNAHATTDA